MQIRERSEAIGRGQRALKALSEHPRSSKNELGHAREHLNACYSHGSGEYVWNAVAQVEAMAERRYGVPSAEEHRQLVDAAGDLGEDATADRGSAAEDRAVSSSTPATRCVEAQRRLTSSSHVRPTAHARPCEAVRVDSDDCSDAVPVPERLSGRVYRPRSVRVRGRHGGSESCSPIGVPPAGPG